MDILDILPEKQLAEIERAGYDLLHRHGYKVKGARRDGRVVCRLRRAMERRGHLLVHSCRKGEEEGVYKLSFALCDTNGNVIGRTKTFRLIFGKQMSNE